MFNGKWMSGAFTGRRRKTSLQAGDAILESHGGRLSLAWPGREKAELIAALGSSRSIPVKALV